MNKKIAIFIMSLCLVSVSTNSSAGPITWLIKGVKTVITKPVKAVGRGASKVGMAAEQTLRRSDALVGLASIGIAAFSLYDMKELQAAPVEPEITEAINNGETSYQTRTCNMPDGVAAVPEYFQVCPDGSDVSYGPVVELTNP